MLTLAYLALAVLGAGYIVIAAALGHFADAGGADGAGTAGPGEMTYGVDHGGHGHSVASDGAVTAFHFPFFSPLALATLFASLGGYGLIAQFGLQVSDGVSVLVAAPAAVATAYGVTWFAHRLVTTSRGSSQIRMDALVGASGEVSVPVPAGGVGEATVMVGPQRYSAQARDADGQALPRGTAVVVRRMAGSTLIVSRRE